MGVLQPLSLLLPGFSGPRFGSASAKLRLTPDPQGTGAPSDAKRSFDPWPRSIPAPEPSQSAAMQVASADPEDASAGSTPVC